jgi:hypothetical protein
MRLTADWVNAIPREAARTTYRWTSIESREVTERGRRGICDCRRVSNSLVRGERGDFTQPDHCATQPSMTHTRGLESPALGAITR